MHGVAETLLPHIFETSKQQDCPIPIFRDFGSMPVGPKKVASWQANPTIWPSDSMKQETGWRLNAISTSLAR